MFKLIRPLQHNPKSTKQVTSKASNFKVTLLGVPSLARWLTARSADLGVAANGCIVDVFVTDLRPNMKRSTVMIVWWVERLSSAFATNSRWRLEVVVVL
jgi:hypothetical protein